MWFYSCQQIRLVVWDDPYVHLGECHFRFTVVNLSVEQAREAVEMRAQLEKKMAQKRKEEKEENLRALAQKAREERAGIRRADGKTH